MSKQASRGTFVVTMPRTDRSIVQTTLMRAAHGGARSRVCAADGGFDQQLPATAVASGDAMLATLLAMLNESENVDSTLQASLDLMTTALGGRIGEIWLRSGDARQLELRYSSSDGSAAVVAFEAVGRGLGSGLSLVNRAVKTGRGSSLPPIKAAGDQMKAGGIRLAQGFGLGRPTLAAEVEDVGAALADRAALTGLRPRSTSLSGAGHSHLGKD